MQDTQGKVIAALMEQLIKTGPEGMTEAFAALFNLAMRMERDQHLGAAPYERAEARRGYANGYKPKKVDTPAGTGARHRCPLGARPRSRAILVEAPVSSMKTRRSGGRSG